MNELVSIIIPVYKVEKYLDICVSSVVRQTYENLEIILVDDGSPDNCPAMCDAWAEKDERIKVIHKENGGVSSARNAGINIASGEYLAFLDSDDWITDDFVCYLLKLIKESGSDVSACGLKNTYSHDVAIEKIDEKINIIMHDDIMREMTKGLCYLCGKLYKRELFSDLPVLPENISVSEDMMLNYFIYKGCRSAAVSNLEKYFYFRHSGSVLAGKITHRIIDDSMLAYKIINDDYDKNSVSYPDFIFNKVMNDYFLLNSIIRNNDCWDRYDILRRDILKSKKYIFSFSQRKIYGIRHVFGTFLLLTVPKLYNESILIRRKIRGY